MVSILIMLDLRTLCDVVEWLLSVWPSSTTFSWMVRWYVRRARTRTNAPQLVFIV